MRLRIQSDIFVKDHNIKKFKQKLMSSFFGNTFSIRSLSQYVNAPEVSPSESKNYGRKIFYFANFNALPQTLIFISLSLDWINKGLKS